MKRILFLCTGNSARSQMAEGLLRDAAGDKAEVFSAGTDPASEVHPLAIRVTREVGIDISQLKPKNVDQFIGQQFDLVITTCNGAMESCPVFPGVTGKEHWDLPDPAAATGTEEERLETFRHVVAELNKRIKCLPPVLQCHDSPDSS